MAVEAAVNAAAGLTQRKSGEISSLVAKIECLHHQAGPKMLIKRRAASITPSGQATAAVSAEYRIAENEKKCAPSQNESRNIINRPAF